MLKSTLSTLALVFCAFSAASAATLTVPFTLSTSDPTFNRPASNLTLSSVGTAVHYTVVSFNLTADSPLTLSLLNADGANLSPSNPDTVLALYQNQFLPGSPLTNIIAYNDDAAGVRQSRIVLAASQSALINYFAVISSFYNVPGASNTSPFPWSGNLIITTDSGATLTSQVPEPATLALTGAALALVLFRRRS
jgi:hypothetical protein